MVELRAADGGPVEGSAEDGVSNGVLRRTVEQIVDLLAPVFPEGISARTKSVELPKIACQEHIEVVKNATQERICERSEAIEVPKISRQENIEVVKNANF